MEGAGFRLRQGFGGQVSPATLSRNRRRLADRATWSPIVIGAIASLLIEIAQIFIHERYVSPVDLVANTTGAWLGVALRGRIQRSTSWRPDLAGRLGLELPLVGLLYLIAPQLWLSGAGLVSDSGRVVTSLLLGCAGSVLVVALSRQRSERQRRRSMSVPLLAMLLFTGSSLSALSASPLRLAAMAIVILVLTWCMVRPDAVDSERRFEVTALRQFLPLLVAYLILTTLWPPLRAVVGWHGAFGFIGRLNDASVLQLLLLLEQVGGFTLLGYAVAEWRGRRELSLGADVPWIAGMALLLAAALELVQGALAGPGASATRALLAATGAAYGTTVYHLARAHVQALREGSLRASPVTVRAAA